MQTSQNTFYERFHSFRLCLLLCFANVICGSCSNSVSHNFRQLFLFSIVREIYLAVLSRFSSIIGFRLFRSHYLISSDDVKLRKITIIGGNGYILLSTTMTLLHQTRCALFFPLVERVLCVIVFVCSSTNCNVMTFECSLCVFFCQ